MKLEIELTDDQLEEIAALVAKKLNAAAGRTRPYSMDELAEEIGISKETVRNRIHAGQIPRVPGIGAIRVPAAAARALIEGRAAS